MQTRRRLTEARALASRLASDDDEPLAVADAHVTSTGVAVVSMADPAGRLRWVVKMPTTQPATRGLRREEEVLAALHSDDRLGEWRALLPRARSQATGGFRVDSALPGVRPSAAAPASVIEAAAETIHVLHRTTAATTTVDAAVADRWVDAPLRELWPRRPRRMRAQLERLRDELHRALLGRSFRASWIHGDFWLGNLLVSQDSGAVLGIVDWDAAAPSELPLHDLLHLVLYTRRSATGAELGALVGAHLHGAPWPGHERLLLELYGGWGELSERHALLLYWLRHTAAHTRQQARRSAPRYRLWRWQNVDRVLAAL
jgi:aminoglycoside phosphotransferase (APT) family kinase protein